MAYAESAIDRAMNHPDVLRNRAKQGVGGSKSPYSPDNPPPYPVSSVNGQTGAVSVAAYPGNSAIIDLIYPVGSIYMSVNSNSPAVLFGGTWQQIEDTFLLAAGQTYVAGSTGGEASHTLTVAEMPEHEHDGIYWGVGYKSTPYPWGLNNDGVGNGFSSTYSGTRGGPDNSHAMYTGEAGGSQAHNNMPPYLAVYVWKRVA